MKEKKEREGERRRGKKEVGGGGEGKEGGRGKGGRGREGREGRCSLPSMAKRVSLERSRGPRQLFSHASSARWKQGVSIPLKMRKNVVSFGL